MSQIQYNFNKNDEYRTPAYAVYPILKRLKNNTSIWCPFDKSDSQYVKVFQAHGFHVVYGHIQTGQDFLIFQYPLVIISSAILHTVGKGKYFSGYLNCRFLLLC